MAQPMSKRPREDGPSDGDVKKARSADAPPAAGANGRSGAAVDEASVRSQFRPDLFDEAVLNGMATDYAQSQPYVVL